MSQLFFNQSGVIPYRIINGKIEILLITSRSKKKWIIPKGLIENGLSEKESAANEALEEAGVEGFIHSTKIGTYKVEKWNGQCNVQVYLMCVEKIHESWLEAYLRKRKWFSINEISETVKREKLREIILSVPEYLLKINQ